MLSAGRSGPNIRDVRADDILRDGGARALDWSGDGRDRFVLSQIGTYRLTIVDFDIKRTASIFPDCRFCGIDFAAVGCLLRS